MALLFAATGVLAAPVMVFNARSATTGIDNLEQWVWVTTSLWETGDHYNFGYQPRDEVVIDDDNGLRITYHYLDITYDVDAHWRDWAMISLVGQANGVHTVQFTVDGVLDPAQASRLVDGELAFQASVFLSGFYEPEPIPGYPGHMQPPLPPVFTNTSSATPAMPPMTTHFGSGREFYAVAEDLFTAPRDLAAYDFSYLLYGNEDLLTNQVDFMLFGPGYDKEVRHKSYTELMSVEIVAIPEPGIWMMLLAGAGVLTLSRHSRSVIFRNGAPFKSPWRSASSSCRE
ncbi:PEP-CTERM sorting domain-containing protein [Pseudoduganella sp. SL102]|uniref:PEP-CTERM sorting domain-containing protein n=1 Tax=Pseudoduganella sp. SL102 TaxID=2995154 RepID=UPI00248BEAD3|nr:PEP-CTERM sorting domain-containing protein [Pseudoduganella sp. SL102]WBS02691.1 PEP-CTERM sorting domain-containing protein [Pseudoduganella sp. SL102]